MPPPAKVGLAPMKAFTSAYDHLGTPTRRTERLRSIDHRSRRASHELGRDGSSRKRRSADAALEQRIRWRLERA